MQSEFPLVLLDKGKLVKQYTIRQLSIYLSRSAYLVKLITLDILTQTE